MRNLFLLLRENFILIILASFFLFALFNPYFKKYDFSSGWPLVLLLGGLVLPMIFREFKANFERSKAKYWEIIFLLVFVGGFAASFYFSQTKNLGFAETLAFIAMVPIYLTFAYQKNYWREGFIKIVAVSVFLAAIEGFLIYFTRAETRMIGPFFNILYHANVWPNAFGLFLLFGWPALLYFLQKKSSYIRFLLILCALIFVLAALLLTFSRGAFIAFGGQVLLLTIFFWRRVRIKAVLVSLCVGLMVAGLFWGANYLRGQQHEIIDVSDRVQFENQQGLTSKQERIDFWLGSWKLALEKPLTGWGPFSFKQAYAGIQKNLLAISDHPHNIFLKFAAENGLITAGAFLGFLIIFLSTLIRRFKKIPEKERPLFYILFTAVAGAFAHNLIDYNFNFIANLLLLFVFLALMRSMVLSNNNRINRNWPALILAIVVFIFSIYEGSVYLLYKFIDQKYLEQAFYTRHYYLNAADFAVNQKNYADALPFIEKQLDLNPIDAQAWYLRGVICEHSNESAKTCLNYYQKALGLNPLNDFNYYVEYAKLLKDQGELESDFVKKITKMIFSYFDMVQNNVHFTGYTTNIEAADALVNVIMPLLDDKTAQKMLEGREKMLKKAARLRSEKRF